MSIARAVHSLRVASLLVAVASLAVGCGAEGAPDDGLEDDSAASESKRGGRYCEVLLAFLSADAIEAQVWGTQGLNDCPEADWASVDPPAIAALKSMRDKATPITVGERQGRLERARALMRALYSRIGVRHGCDSPLKRTTRHEYA